MTTITRRRRPLEAIKVPVLLRFVDGRVVDPSTCPRGISASTHWRLDPNVDREVNTICNCTPAIDVEDLV